MTFLVVDDDKLNLEIAKHYLTEFFPEFTVLTCQNPMFVMELLETEEIDIILLDIVMPELCGTDILKEIRKISKYKDVQILMFTTITDDESFESCFDFGANDYLQKPIQQTIFKARIKSAVSARKNVIELHLLNENAKKQNKQLRKVNAQLKDMQFSLIQSEKLAAIGELAAGVAHEINNPISYVGSNLEILSTYLSKIREFINVVNDKIDPENEELYSKIQEVYNRNKLYFILNDIDEVIFDSKEGIGRVTKIVGTLQNFAHTGMENMMHYCSLKDILDQVMLLIKSEARQVATITINNFDVPDIYCNKSQIGQVFLNIILNAIQAIKQQKRSELGSITITIYEKEGFVWICMKDDGPGISEAILSKIFEPFFTTKDVGQGTGLGLSISHNIIVKKHKGELTVTSQQGVGSEFIVKMPLKIH